MNSNCRYRENYHIIFNFQTNRHFVLLRRHIIISISNKTVNLFFIAQETKEVCISKISLTGT